jgi:hypothetical protein
VGVDAGGPSFRSKKLRASSTCRISSEHRVRSAPLFAALRRVRSSEMRFW